MKYYIILDEKSFGIYTSEKEYKFDTPEDLRHVDFLAPFYSKITCFAIFYSEKDMLNLSWISTNPLYYGKGFATNILYKIIDIAKHHKKRYIMLDDCSGVPPPKNLYYKLGFKVKNEKGKWVAWKNDMIVDEERRFTIRYKIAR